MNPSLLAFLICVGAAAAEGVLAGPNPRQRLADLRMPAYSPPFSVWLAIGLAYYIICFVVLRHLLAARFAGFGYRVAQRRNRQSSFRQYQPLRSVLTLCFAPGATSRHFFVSGNHLRSPAFVDSPTGSSRYPSGILGFSSLSIIHSFVSQIWRRDCTFSTVVLVPSHNGD